MEISKIIGNNLKEARKFKGLTQREVASQMKMTQQQYSRFENGVFQLNYEQILFLCDLFDVTPNELFSIND
ncbi:MAG: helix-turn-helix transcriptional regulator [Clostridia bacterium]|nr:helix-turn-helix transcriptional regulator [Clostridia bacterium]